MSHHRKNSERDRVISKKRIYSDSERSARHRRSVSHRGGRVWPQNVAWLVFIGWVISYANEWEGYSDCILEGVEISGIWSTAHSVVFWQGLGTVTAPLGVSLHLLLEDQDLVLSAILEPVDSNRFTLCPGAMSFFQKLCPLPFPPVMGLLPTLGHVQGLRWSVSSSWCPFVVLWILSQLISWLFLPWLPTILNCHLKLSKGHGGWSLAYKKWEKKVSMPTSPTESFSVSLPDCKDEMW